jgi:hypothetical protein
MESRSPASVASYQRDRRRRFALRGRHLGVALALALLIAPCSGRMIRLSAVEEAECPTGDEWLACRARTGDRNAMYALGRNAYEAARTSGDFSEALDWARKLNALGEKNGERLLKMVHLQLGWGGHRDYVQAYVWLTEAIAAGHDYVRPLRRQLEEKMTPEQLAQARSKAGQ